MQIGKVKVSGLLLFLLFSAAPLLAQTKLAAVPQSNTAPVPQEQDHGSGDNPDLVPLRTPQGKAINLECETEPLADSRKVYVTLFPTNDGLLMSVYISKPNGDDMVMLREGVLQPDMDHPGSFVEHFKNRVTPLATWLNLSLVAKKPVFRLVLNLPIPPDNTKVKLFPYKGTCHVAGEMQLPTDGVKKAEPKDTPLARDSEGAPALDAERSIRQALDNWVQSFRNKDARAQADCYAPVVETYFRWHNVPREQLAHDKEKSFAAIGEIRKYEISEIQVSVQPAIGNPDSTTNYNRADAIFQKEWDTSTVAGKIFAGREIEKLTFVGSPEGWKIVGEQELKILQVVRQ